MRTQGHGHDRSPTGRWRVLANSVAGTSHKERDRQCEDHYTILRHPGGALLLALADGAGSATRAREGAEYATRVACEAAADMLTSQGEPNDVDAWRALLQAVLQKTRGALESLIKIAPARGDEPVPAENSSDALNATDQSLLLPPAGLSLQEYDTTLQCVITTEQWLAAAQIGDGAVVVQHTDGSLQAVTWPDHGVYINETRFITEYGYLQWVQYVVRKRPEIRGIAMFSDGLEFAALHFKSHQPYEPFFTPLFAFAAQADVSEEYLTAKLADFLESEDVCATTNDDKTLILAIHPDEESS